MLIITKRRFVKKRVVGGAGLFGSIGKFLARIVTSDAAKKIASELGKKAIDVGSEAVSNAGKKLMDKAENVIKNYVNGSGGAIAIQDLVKRLNTGSGLKIV